MDTGEIAVVVMKKGKNPKDCLFFRNLIFATKTLRLQANTKILIYFLREASRISVLVAFFIEGFCLP
jgi:hypothetical protein